VIGAGICCRANAATLHQAHALKQAKIVSLGTEPGADPLVRSVRVHNNPGALIVQAETAFSAKPAWQSPPHP